MELLLPVTLNTWLVIIGLLSFIWIAWQNTRNALAWILLLLPSFLIRFTILGLPATFLECLIWITFITWLLKDKQYQKINYRFDKKTINLVPPVYRLAITLILLAATISVFVSPNKIAALGIWKAYFVEALLFFILVIYNIKNHPQAFILLDALGVLTLILFLLAIFQKLTGLTIPNDFWANAETRRITTILQFPNANGLFAGPVVALFLGYLKKADKQIMQIFKTLVIIAGLLIILWAESAGALIGLAGALVIALLLKKKTRSFALALVIVAIMIPLNIPSIKYAASDTWDRINNNQLDLQSNSLEIRVNQWKETQQMLVSSPTKFTLGTGLSGYQTSLLPFHQYKFLEIFFYPHNIFLNFWTELGLLGLGGFLLLFVVSFKDSLKIYTDKIKQPLNIGLFLALATTSIHGLVDVPYFKNDLSLIFWLLIALVVFNNYHPSKLKS